MTRGIEAGMLLLGIPGVVIGLIVLLFSLFLKRRTASIVGTLITALSLFSLLFSYYATGVSMKSLPYGTLIGESRSPMGNYILEMYRVDGGVTVDSAVRVQVDYQGAGKHSRNIYWGNTPEVTVYWINSNTVSINGHHLNVLRDTYDWRNNPWPRFLGR